MACQLKVEKTRHFHLQINNWKKFPCFIFSWNYFSGSEDSVCKDKFYKISKILHCTVLISLTQKYFVKLGTYLFSDRISLVIKLHNTLNDTTNKSANSDLQNGWVVLLLKFWSWYCHSSYWLVLMRKSPKVTVTHERA